MYYHIFACVLGEILVAGDDEGIRYVNLQVPRKTFRIKEEWIRDKEAAADVCEQLNGYFAGEVKTFDLTLAPEGTEFQKGIWKALLHIPYGKTVSYKDIACSTGNPGASRAVGLANSHNPIQIIIPCHRVIGSNGTLTGYAHGLEIKSWLRDLEARSG